MKRIVLAFVLAPLAVPALFGAWMLTHGAPDGALLFLVVTGLYTYGATVVAGLPAVFLYRHMGWSRAWQFGVGGFLLGTAIFASTASALALAAAFYGGLGALTALVFWFVGVCGNGAFARPRPAARTADPLPPPAGGAERAPVFGVTAVGISLLAAVAAQPGLWAALRPAIDRLYTAGLLILPALTAALLALATAAVGLAVVAILRRERYRHALAAAAVLLAAASLALLYFTFYR